MAALSARSPVHSVRSPALSAHSRTTAPPIRPFHRSYPSIPRQRTRPLDSVPSRFPSPAARPKLCHKTPYPQPQGFPPPTKQRLPTSRCYNITRLLLWLQIYEKFVENRTPNVHFISLQQRRSSRPYHWLYFTNRWTDRKLRAPHGGCPLAFTASSSARRAPGVGAA